MWKSKIYAMISNLTYFSRKCFIIFLDTRSKFPCLHPSNFLAEFLWTFTTLGKFSFLLNACTLALPSPGNTTQLMSMHAIWSQIENCCTHEILPAEFKCGDWNVRVSSGSILHCFIHWQVNKQLGTQQQEGRQALLRRAAALQICNTSEPDISVVRTAGAPAASGKLSQVAPALG